MTLNRRAFLNACSCAGIASPLLPGILLTLVAQAQEAAPDAKTAALPKITPEMLDQAAELAGVGPFTAEQKKMMLDGLNDQREAYAQIRALKMANDVPPAYVFHPQPAANRCEAQQRFTTNRSRIAIHRRWCRREPLVAPAHIEDLAFATVSELAAVTRPQDHLARPDADVSRPPQAVRSQAAFRHHAHRRPRAGAGQKSRRRDCRRQISRAAARDSRGARRICWQ